MDDLAVLSLLALTPILLVGVLLVGFRPPAMYAMPAGHIAVSAGNAVVAQAAGGVAGNMVTVHNVVAASAVVGLLGREGDVLRQTVLPMIYYLLGHRVAVLRPHSRCGAQRGHRGARAHPGGARSPAPAVAAPGCRRTP